MMITHIPPTFTPADIYLLADESHKYHYNIRENCFLDLGKEVAKEIKEFNARKPELFVTTGIGRDEKKTFSSEYRGDLRCWLNPKLCNDEKLPFTLQLVKYLMGIAKQFKAPLSLNGDYSIQVTKYPGNGARYVRHFDTFFDGKATPSYRKLTMIYYLNDEFDGGRLRIFKNHTLEKDELPYFDVDPKLGNLVLFRSEYIEHEVLPSNSDRYAITVWASSSVAPVPQQLKHSSPKIPISLQKDKDQSLSQPLPISNLHEDSHDSIFVSIINYSDTEGPRTLSDLFEKASRPERIFVGYVYQGNYEDEGMISSHLIFESEAISKWINSNVRVLFLHEKDATGPCYARHLCGQLWRNENFFLQTDSHMRFRPNWDNYLIELYKRIKIEQQTRPILTTYPLGYHLPNDIPKDTRPTILVPWKFDENGMLRQKATAIWNSSSNQINQIEKIPYFKSPLWAAGFSFSDSSILHQVPYSSHLPYLFFGEEPLMALRFYSHGYNFYAPGEAVVYHLYSRKHRATIQSRGPTAEQKMMKEESMQIVQSFFQSKSSENQVEIPMTNVQINYQLFGLGNHRSIDQFAKEIGVNFQERMITESHLTVDYFVPRAYRNKTQTKTNLFSDGIFAAEDDELQDLKNQIFQSVLLTNPQAEKSANIVNQEKQKALSNILDFLKPFT